MADAGLTFHSVLGSGSASNKLKAMSAGPRLQVFSTADSMSTTLDMSNFHAALGYGDRNQGYTVGFTQTPALTWGSFEVKPGDLRAYSTQVNASTVSTDVLSFDIPVGSRSCVTQHLQWDTCAYIDLY